MAKIIVASRNPVKIEATRQGFQKMFPGVPLQVEGVAVPSGVDEQPRSDAQTLTGAQNRAAAARQAVPEADFWVGIEGGIESCGGEMFALAWIVILSPARMGKSRTGTFVLPPEVARQVRQGAELGPVNDQLFGLENSKQNRGAVGILTNDIIDRTALYEHAVILALIPFKNTPLF